MCKVKKLGDYITMHSGKGFKASEYSESGVRLIKINNVGVNGIKWDDIEYLPLEYLETYPKLKLVKGDLLLALNRPILNGELKVGILSGKDSPSILYQRVGKIIIGDTQKLNQQFLFWFFKSKFFINELTIRLDGADQPFITNKKLFDIEFNFCPPLPEQQRIVAKLDGLFAKIDKAIGLLEDNIAHTQALMGSVLDSEFGRLESKFGKVELITLCDKITDGSHHSPKATEKGTIPYVTVRDVSWEGEIDTFNCKKISKTDFIELEKNGCKPLIGDVLLSKDGTVGKVAIVDFDIDWVVLSSLAIIRPNKTKLETTYLSWMLKTPKIQELAIGLKTGAAIKRIVLRTIKTIKIPIPKDIKEQIEISNYFDDLNKPYQKLVETQTQKLNHLKALKSSLLDQAFKGEL